MITLTATVALRKLSWWEHILRGMRAVQIFLMQRDFRRMVRLRIKAVEAQHVLAMRNEGLTIHETRDGWFVTFTVEHQRRYWS